MEYSTNLATWLVLSRFYSEGGTYGFVDAGTSEFRYYRLKELYRYYSIAGQVLDECSLLPVAGAFAYAYGISDPFVTGVDGHFQLRVPGGHHELYAWGNGYYTSRRSITVDSSSSSLRLHLHPRTPTPPPNDNFTNRIRLTNFPVTVKGSLCTSREEMDDPVIYDSLWWTWTAPFSGKVTLSLDVERYDTGYLAVYEGNALPSLTPVNGGYLRDLRFDAVAGRTYQIAIGRFGGAEWTLRLAAAPEVSIFAPRDGQELTAPANVPFTVLTSDLDGSVALIQFWANDHLIGTLTNASDQFTWRNVPAGEYRVRVRATDNLGDSTSEWRTLYVHPANDAFAGRIALTGSNVLTRGTAVAATAEFGEPRHGRNPSDRTIWWSWTAPFTGPATVLANGTLNSDAAVAVYTGSQLNALVSVASNDGPNTPRQVTFAAVEGTLYAIVLSGYRDDVKLQILPTAPPSITIVTPTNNQVFAALANVVVQTDAVDPEGSINSVKLFVDDTDYKVNGGQVTLSNLNSGSYNLRARATDGGGALGFSERVMILVRLLNDNFAGRIALTGAVVNVIGTTVGASREQDEPYHGGYYPQQTVWWSWTAPATGTVTMSTAGSDFNTVLAVYTGVNLFQLHAVASNDNSTDQTSRVTFPVSAGTTYQIAVGSPSYRESGRVILSIALQ